MIKINYKIFVPVLLLILFAAYFIFVANYVFYKMGQGNLKYVDMNKVYIINENLETKDNLVYAALGDSLTAGIGTDKFEESLPYVLAEKIAGDKRRVVLADFAVPGYKSQDLLDVLVDPAVNVRPDVITLFIGTNDVYGNVSEAEFVKNYRATLDKIKADTTAKVYLISIPFIGSSSVLLPPYDLYCQNRIENFNKEIYKLSKAYGFVYVDIANPTKDLLKNDGPHYAADSFHLSVSGYALWADIIYENINR